MVVLVVVVVTVVEGKDKQNEEDIGVGGDARGSKSIRYLGITTTWWSQTRKSGVAVNWERKEEMTKKTGNSNSLWQLPIHSVITPPQTQPPRPASSAGMRNKVRPVGLQLDPHHPWRPQEEMGWSSKCSENPLQLWLDWPCVQ